MVLYKHSDSPKANVPISTNLYLQLQKDILTGKLKNGQKLTEQVICEEYNVSRTPVREALRQLESEGLVENILNRGSFVVGLSKQDFEDMFELRKIYEIQAVKWAIERITEEEMESLHDALEECVNYKAHTPSFLGEFNINTFSGFSMYLPKRGSAQLDRYYRTLKWNEATGLVQ